VAFYNRVHPVIRCPVDERSSKCASAEHPSRDWGIWRRRAKAIGSRRPLEGRVCGGITRRAFLGLDGMLPIFGSHSRRCEGTNALERSLTTWRHADLPDDLVFRVVKAAFENHEQMMEVHAAAAATVPANITRNSFLPLHSGAIRYYRQIGVAGLSD
jgi:hypothetical protein